MIRTVTILIASGTIWLQQSNPVAASFIANAVQNTVTAAQQDDADYFYTAIDSAAKALDSVNNETRQKTFVELESSTEPAIAPPQQKTATYYEYTPVSDVTDASGKMDFIRRLNESELAQLRKVVKYTAGTPFKEGLTGLAGQVQHDFYRMALEYNRLTGKTLIVGSAYRSAAYQVGVKRQFGKDAASPGWSQHQHGYSIDINRVGRTSPQVQELHKMGLLQKFGFIKDNPSGEAWHIEHKISFSRFTYAGLAYAAKLSLQGHDGFEIHRRVAMVDMINNGYATINGGRVVILQQNGKTIAHVGGTVAWRNNNPGNLKFVYKGSADQTVKTKRSKKAALISAQKTYVGVVGLDAYGNLIFDTPEHGRQAQARLLRNKHGDKTVIEMLPHYAKDDYSGKANHQSYANKIYAVADSEGHNLRNKRISSMTNQEMDSLLKGMAAMEGITPGVTKTL